MAQTDASSQINLSDDFLSRALFFALFDANNNFSSPLTFSTQTTTKKLHSSVLSKVFLSTSSVIKNGNNWYRIIIQNMEIFSRRG